MKKIMNILAVAVLALSGASCVKSALDPLDNKYPEVQQLNLGSVLENGGVKDVDGFNVFSLKGRTGIWREGTILSAKRFVAGRFFLPRQ